MARRQSRGYLACGKASVRVPGACRFEATSTAVRAARAAGGNWTRPLADRLVCIHSPSLQAPSLTPTEPANAPAPNESALCKRARSSGSGSGLSGSTAASSMTRAARAAADVKAAEHKQGLQRLVVALGGRVRATACHVLLEVTYFILLDL